MSENSNPEQNPLNGTAREKTIIRTCLIGIIANVFLAAFKAVIGLMSNSIAPGLGFGLGSSSAVQAFMPQWMKYIFGGSGIVPAAFPACRHAVFRASAQLFHDQQVPCNILGR